MAEMAQGRLSELPELLVATLAKMSLYLQNRDTTSLLFKPIRTQVFMALSQLSRCVELEYLEEEASAAVLGALAKAKTAVMGLS